MGGLGSGARRARLGVDECRSLEIGELCDGGRLRARSRGEVLWRAKHGAALRARLSYAISEQPGATLLSYRYWPTGAEASHTDEFALEALRGRRSYARCPRCGRRVA